MKSIKLWDPWRDLEESKRRFDALFGGETSKDKELLTRQDWSPRVDIIENPETYQIHAELPDVKKENMKVDFDNGVLTLSGERRAEYEDRKDRIHRVERSYGSFMRSFSLPSDADGERIEATYRDGVLKVKVPKFNEQKAKPIQIKVED